MKLLAYRLIALLLVLILLAGCASTPPRVHQNMRAETDDLGMVTEWSLTMADTFGTRQVLVVFDIDNTLLAMEQDLGSDQWYYWQKDLAEQDPCSAALVSNRFAVQGAMYFASAMRPTQPDAAAQLKTIQDAGLPVIALTSRGADYQLQTFRELRRNGMTFWPNALPPRHGWPGAFIPQDGTRPTLYQDGVFLTAGQHKGLMLRALLKQTGFSSPEIIVIVDDKAENLDAVMETFGNTATSVHAWRYTREDATVAAFDAEEAEQMWHELKPSLLQIQELLGPDNYDLAGETARPGCGG
jgi:hypothetical protein